MTPRTLIIRTAGTNCDVELAHAFAQAGCAIEKIHLNRLINDPALIERFDLIGIPGGFSYGDDISAGRILANRLRHRLLDPLRAAIGRGVPIIGICNGFQVLIKMGLLPDPADGVQRATLADNTSGRFVDRWVELRAEQSVCIWTRGLATFELPIAHGEGRFVPADAAVLRKLRDGGQIALRYVDNINGSVDDIAGICDPSGLVLGLMPHPERFNDPTNHPQWTRKGGDFLQRATPGQQCFQNAVRFVREKAGSLV